jgi:hypothetical protein
VLPVSPTPITLHALTSDGHIVDGQSHVMRTTGIDRVWITPADVHASEDALAAIADAELIVLGPGSLYTSLLPSLMIPAIRDAVMAATAPRIFVCNVATQEGETTDFDLADHVEALVAHTSPNLIDLVVANNRLMDGAGGGDDASGVGEPSAGPRPVVLRWPPSVVPVPRLILDEVIDTEDTHHHDPARLASAVIAALEGEVVVRRRHTGRSTSRTA